MNTEDRFWSNVDKTDDCWLWTGHLHSLGYARFWVDAQTRVYVHRYAYELLVGPIPKHLEIDHLCGIRHCVNPSHLEAVTHRENLRRSDSQVSTINARKTRCLRGHEFSHVDRRGWRVCDRCIAIRRAS